MTVPADGHRPGQGLGALQRFEVLHQVGLLAGVLARGLVGARLSLFASLLTGVAGALAGTLAAEGLGLPAASSLAVLALAALAGATLLLSIFTLVLRR